MKILVCCDSFKDSLASEVISSCIRDQIINKFPLAEIICVLMADGGENSLEIFKNHQDWSSIEIDSVDALNRPIKCELIRNKESNHYLIEMAQSCGIQHLDKAERNCYHTSSYGTGMQIKYAISQGAKKVSLFIGGSATNDLGLGMISALGGKFYKNGDLVLRPEGKDLIDITSYDLSEVIADDVEFTVVADVKNKLLGEDGAARTYAHQKGASDDEILKLEKGTKCVLRLLDEDKAYQCSMMAGSGAAGGMGFGAMYFLNANLVPGVDYLIDQLQLKEKIDNADLVITGEGKLDSQTLYGKVVSGIAKLCLDHQIKCIAVTAINELSKAQTDELHLDEVFALYQSPPEQISISDTKERLSEQIDIIIDKYLSQ